jgi:phospholipid/cholesterol/gamma-HCH transport system substrate-binding protein
MRTDTEASVHDDATFTTTTQGVMSEQYISVDPGTPERSPLAHGAIVRGIDSPRLDVVLADSFHILETATVAMRDNRHELEGMFDDVVAIHRAARSLSTDHADDVDAILENGRILRDEGGATIDAARAAYVDGERARRILRNLDRTAEVLDEQGPELLRRGEAIGSDVGELSDTFGDEQRRQLDSTLTHAERIAEAVERTRGEAEEIATHVEEGRGSVGAFRADEELHDDLLRTYRDLLHNPWRFFWRE